jgi:hypothetical protein
VVPPITAEGRTSTEPASDDDGFDAYAFTAICRGYFGFANGNAIVWIHVPHDATLPTPQTFRDKSAKLRGSKEAMPNTSDSVRNIRTEDGRILLDVRHGQMFSLNVVGSKILELIEQGWDEARIVEEISRANATTVEVARTDIHDFIEALDRNRILQTDRLSDSI